MSQFGSPGGSFGPNAWLVDDMYDRFLADPDSVSGSWREFFADYRPAPVPAPVPASAPPSQAPSPAPTGEPQGGEPQGGAAVPAATAPAPAPTGGAGNEE